MYEVLVRGRWQVVCGKALASSRTICTYAMAAAAVAARQEFCCALLFLRTLKWFDFTFFVFFLSFCYRVTATLLHSYSNLMYTVEGTQWTASRLRFLNIFMQIVRVVMLGVCGFLKRVDFM